MKVLLVGCTGFIGRNLVRRLVQAEHDCTVLLRTRSSTPPDDFSGRVKFISQGEKPTEIDAVINLAGEPVPGLWTHAKKERIMNSRVDPTRGLVEWMEALTKRPTVFLSASAVGFYGDRGGETITERTTSDPARRFRSQVCTRWEEEANAARALGIRVVNLRLGNVLDPQGGFLGKLLPLIKLSPVLVPYATGAYFPWVSLQDAVGIIEYSMTKGSVNGPINVVAPNPATYGEMFDSLGLALHKRVACHIPSWMIKIALGEFSQAVIESQKVLPEKIVGFGYKFVHPELRQFLGGLSGKL